MLFLFFSLAAFSCATENTADENTADENTTGEIISSQPGDIEADKPSMDLTVNEINDDKSGHSAGAEEINQQSGIEEDPSASIYQNAMDMVYDARYEEAVDLLKEYLKYHPDSADAMNSIGYSYYKSGDNDKAEIWYKQTIETDSLKSDPSTYLGKIYTDRHKYQSAIDMYSALIEIDKENPEGYFGLGLVYNKVNMYEDSLNFMDTAILYYLKHNSEETLEAYYLQGLNYYYTGQTEKAYSYLSAIEDYYLEDTNLRMILIDIREQLNNN